ncbi:hypothetical protein PR048_009341 [Dryococelus australis]|uniref:Reverse transcriptase n=1 Tax=Dryococelus australis TaxID=614101 RepID=A0ABQ9I000_9NEOP|nr:hypothetical protein PR048_009341 [Dryococelus australis]
MKIILNVKLFKANLQVKEAIPVYHKAYDVPYALLGQLGQQLEELQNSGKIIPIKHCAWVSPIVLVPKKQGSLRMCVDFKVAQNKVLNVDYYPLLKREDLVASLAGRKIFFCVKLGRKSIPYVTMNNQGLFQWTRLP